MKIKYVRCSNPKGYRNTHLFFYSINSAERYIKSKNKEFLLDKAKQLEHPSLSKKKRKDLFHLNPKKYLLTSIGNKFCLWEQILIKRRKKSKKKSKKK